MGIGYSPLLNIYYKLLTVFSYLFSSEKLISIADLSFAFMHDVNDSQKTAFVKVLNPNLYSYVLAKQ